MESLFAPNWPVPPGIGSAVTTRCGGASEGPWSGFNLALHVGDDPEAVAANRATLQRELGLAAEPVWLSQVHSTEVIAADAVDGQRPECDGSLSRRSGQACVVVTADCLPLLFCDRDASVVAAVHGGWRGLAGGIVRNAVAKLAVDPERLLVYLGPAISQRAFEVGPEVREAFLANAIDGSHRRSQHTCFQPSANQGKLMADLYGLARGELHALGVSAVYGGDHCTYGEPERFYSFRRDGVTGRMASLIWLRD